MKKRLLVFLEFLIGGIFLGIVEDVLLIKIVTTDPMTYTHLLIIFLITLPFAFLGEYVVDRIDFLKLFKLSKKYSKAEVFLEFLIFGVILGVAEDLTAFYFAVGDRITPTIILTSFLIAIPFAFTGEFLIDKVDLRKTFKRRRITLKNKG